MTVLRELIARIKLDTKRAKGDLQQYDKLLDDTKKSTEDVVEETEELGDVVTDTAQKSVKAGKRISRSWSNIGKSAKSAGKSIASAGATAGKGLGVIAAATLAASAGLFAFTKQWAESTDEIGKRAGKLGVAADALQELRFVFGQSGAEAQSLSDVLKEIQIRSIDAVKSGTGPFAEAAGALGLDFRQLAEDSPVVAFEKIRRELSKMEASSKRTALAVALLGEQGIELGEVINLTEEEFRGLRQEANELGLVLGEEALQSAADLNDELARTGAVVGGIQNDLAVELVPVVREVLVEFRAWVRENRELIRTKLVEFVRNLIRAIEELSKLLFALLDIFNKVLEVTGGLTNAIELLAGAFVALKLAALGPIGAILAGFVALGVAVDVYKRKLKDAARAEDELADKKAFSEEERQKLSESAEGRRVLSELDKSQQQLDRTTSSLEKIEAEDRLTFDEFSSEDDVAQRENLRNQQQLRDQAIEDKKRLEREGRARLELRDLDILDADEARAAAAAEAEEPVFGIRGLAGFGPAEKPAARPPGKTRGVRKTAQKAEKKKVEKKAKEERDATIGELLGFGEGGAVVSGATTGKGLGTTIINQTFNIGIPSIRIEVAAARGATVRDQAVATAGAVRDMMPDIVKQTQRAAVGQLS